eukprot:TRINITY_DN62425_c0_g1_i1.p1 TRINITY_DN62425_c0_g1~~TRINITY_DN62425_c0_g1_i1.p1  ORF type:complete len:238 (+),score=52.33 TRINITY_DN62425_c0_g1_i1:75-788(+)
MGASIQCAADSKAHCGEESTKPRCGQHAAKLRCGDDAMDLDSEVQVFAEPTTRVLANSVERVVNDTLWELSGRTPKPQWDRKACIDMALLRAASVGDCKTIEQALRQGACVDATQQNFLKPHKDATTAEPGADMKQARVTTLTPLMRAAHQGHSQAVKVLVQAGADVKAMDMDGMTPLHLAAEAGCVQTVEILLTAGADASSIDDFDRAPLDCAPPSVMAGFYERRQWRRLLAHTDV